MIPHKIIATSPIGKAIRKCSPSQHLIDISFLRNVDPSYSVQKKIENALDIIVGSQSIEIINEVVFILSLRLN
jgi:hypothetical protein